MILNDDVIRCCCVYSNGVTKYSTKLEYICDSCWTSVHHARSQIHHSSMFLHASQLITSLILFKNLDGHWQVHMNLETKHQESACWTELHCWIVIPFFVRFKYMHMFRKAELFFFIAVRKNSTCKNYNEQSIVNTHAASVRIFKSNGPGILNLWQMTKYGLRSRTAIERAWGIFCSCCELWWNPHPPRCNVSYNKYNVHAWMYMYNANTVCTRGSQ